MLPCFAFNHEYATCIEMFTITVSCLQPISSVPLDTDSKQVISTYFKVITEAIAGHDPQLRKASMLCYYDQELCALFVSSC